MDFQEKLQTLRRKHGMSQEKLAARLGVSRQAVSKWESGQSRPDTEKLVALGDVFGISIDSLIRDAQDVEQGTGASNSVHGFRMRYEYKSKKTLFGLPLVHIHFGTGLYVAKGILAVGNISAGVLSFGLISTGGLCFGLLSLGLIGFGSLVLGLLCAAGGIAAGTLAAGGIAIGIFSLGGLSVGMFSIGGAAFASHVAIGDVANGHIAVGRVAHGAVTLVSHARNGSMQDISGAEVREIIQREYPNLWHPIIDWLTLFLR